MTDSRKAELTLGGFCLVALCAVLIWGCAADDPAEPPAGTMLRAPSPEQMSLDLPPSLATTVAGKSGDGPDCEGEEYPGPVFVCVTRFIVGDVAVGTVGHVQRMLEEVMASVADQEIPAGESVVFMEGELEIGVVWEDGAESATYGIEFRDGTGGATIGSWQWTIAADGSADGRFRMVEELMQDETGELPVPDGIDLVFAANADGSEKSIQLDLDLGDAPPPDDLGAPTSLRIHAFKDAAGWTVQYGMFHPLWFADEQTGEGGQETYLLISAVGGLDTTDPAVMKAIALAGTAEAVPVEPDEDHSLCDYVAAYAASQGWGWEPACDDNNPFYVQADGTVVEGGEPPAGFGTLAAAVASLPYIVEDPAIIRQVEVVFDPGAR